MLITFDESEDKRQRAENTEKDGRGKMFTQQKWKQFPPQSYKLIQKI